MENNPAEQPTPPVQPIAEPENQNFLSSKWLKIGIGALLVILILGTTFVLGGKLMNKPQNSVTTVATQSPSLTPTPVDETANWKTYNNQYLSFKYPSDWKIADPFSNIHNSPDYVGIIPLNKTPGGGTTPILIRRYDNSKNLSLQKWEEETDAKAAMSANLYSNEATTTTIAGLTAYVSDKGHCDPYFCYRAILMAKNNIFVFSNVKDTNQYSEQELQSYQEIFNKILPTLKFTDQTSQNSSNNTLTNLNIPELNIKITLSDEIKDLAYFPKTNNGITGIFLWTNSLVSAGEKEKTNGVNYCAADQAPLGSFSKIYKANLTEDPNQPWWNRLSALRDATKERSDGNGNTLPIQAKEFSDFFIFYTPPQQSCSNNSSITSLQNADIKAIEKSIPTIDLIQ